MSLHCACLCLFWCFIAEAQPLSTDKTIRDAERLTIENGLSQGFIYWIYQDSQGFVWICTKDGVNRFDGYGFKIFRNNPEVPTSLVANEIAQIVEDKQHNLWINAINKGVDLFIRESEMFVHFNASSPDGLKLSSDRIYSVELVNDREVAVVTDAGVDVISYEVKDNAQRHIHGTADLMEKYTFRVRRLHCDRAINYKKLTLMAIGNNKIIGLVEGEMLELQLAENLMVRPLILPPALSAPIDPGQAKYCKHDALRNRFFIFYGSVIYICQDDLSSMEYIPNMFSMQSYLPRSLDIDENGQLYAAHSGIVECLPYGARSMVRYTIEQPEWPIFASTAAMSICIDRSGLWWIGTPGYGIIKYNSDRENFHHTYSETVANRSFYAMSSATDSTALVSGNGQIWSLDPQRKTALMPLSANGALGAKSDVMYGHAAIQDKQGNYWVADQRYLTFINVKTGKQSQLYSYSEEYAVGFTPLLMSKDESVWLATPNTLCQFISPQSPPLELPFPEEYRSSPDLAFVHSILENGNVIWVGTIKGILGWDRVAKAWIAVVHKENEQHSIPNARVYALANDPLCPDKFIWAGLNGQGLCRIDLHSHQSMVFNASNGLPNDVVYGVLFDRQNRLWASTNAGLSCIQPEYQSKESIGILVRNFARTDGLQSSEFNRYGAVGLNNGTLVFAGVNGINSFDPMRVLLTNPVPLIAITDIRCRQISMTYGSLGSELNCAPQLLSELVLSPGQDMLTIEFSVLEFTNATKNRFKYKLQGFADEWIDIGESREAHFTKLDPGEYVFTVIGCDSQGVWNLEGKTITIRVLPAWWQTWWFRLLMVLATVTALFGIYRYRMRQIRKIQLVRDRIARDLHDDIGSTLSSISLYSDLVKSRAITGLPEMAPIAEKISESSHRLMDNMSDIVWAINPENDHLGDVISRMRSVAAEITEAAGVELKFEADAALALVKLDMEARRNLYLIFREGLNNAMKYGNAKCIHIRMGLEGAFYVLEIIDNGVGFDMANHKRGNGLINMSKRGSLLKGSCDIQSELGKGTRVVLQFKT